MLFTLAKSNVNLIPVTTAEYPASVAKRPAYSVLENAKLNSPGERKMVGLLNAKGTQAFVL